VRLWVLECEKNFIIPALIKYSAILRLLFMSILTYIDRDIEACFNSGGQVNCTFNTTRMSQIKDSESPVERSGPSSGVKVIFLLFKCVVAQRLLVCLKADE
jgi:hypothetical protein